MTKVIFLRGDIDIAADPDVEDAVQAVESTASEVLFDLRNVTYVDVHGLTNLRSHVRRLSEDGRTVRFVNVPEPVRRVLRTLASAEPLDDGA